MNIFITCNKAESQKSPAVNVVSLQKTIEQDAFKTCDIVKKVVEIRSACIKYYEDSGLKCKDKNSVIDILLRRTYPSHEDTP